MRICLIGIPILVIVALTVLFTIKGCSSAPDTRPTEIHSGVKWDGEKHVNSNSDNTYAYIPGFTELTFKEDTVHQKVNFYNPEVNPAQATLTLKLADGTVLWQEENIRPGYGFYDIDINKPLSRGFYNASLTYTFFSDTGEEYNGGIVPFELIVI